MQLQIFNFQFSICHSPTAAMSLNSTRSRLTALTKQLSLRWQETREHWQDAKAADFERQHLEELFNRVNNAAASIEDLEVILTKIRRDCE